MPQVTRKGSGKPPALQKSIDEKSNTCTSTDSLSSVKHAHIPLIPNCNTVLFNFIALVFSLTATLMQYLHLYRTVWWLPQSYAKKALNFYLIDSHLFGYLIVMETLPFLYSVCKQIFQLINKRRVCLFIFIGISTCVAVIWIGAFLFFSYCVYTKTPGFYLLILFYPPIAYALIYYHYVPNKLYLSARFRLRSFLHPTLLNSGPALNTDSNTGGSTTSSSINPKPPDGCHGQVSSEQVQESPTHKLTVIAEEQTPTPTPIATSQSTSLAPSATDKLSKQTATFADFASNPSPTQLALEQYGIFYYSKTVRHSSGFIHHNCTMNPEEVRDEVEKLKADFNRKFRDIFFGTLFTFFYASLVPLLFVPKFEIFAGNGTVVAPIHYDGVWCGQHVFVTAVTAFLLYSVHHLTPAYVDVLHRCALHLGRWRREEGRSANVPYNAWSQLQIFPQGALVKHVRGLFRAVGAYNSAEPGNNMHNRFFCFFYPSLRLINVMCTLVFLILIFQYVLLIQNYEWYKIISVGGMMFFNVFSLYKILRNRFLLGRCYKEESFSNGCTNGSAFNGSISTMNVAGSHHLHAD